MTTPPPSVNPYTEPVTAPTRPNSLARASVVVAIVLVALAIVFQLVGQFAPMFMVQTGVDASGIGIMFAVFTVLELLLGILGFVLGFAGSRRGDSLLQAGIGIGVGGSVAITAIVSLVATPLVGLLY